MHRSWRTAVAFGVLAACFWAPHFGLMERLRTGPDGPARLVLTFYFLLGAAAFLLAYLFLTGRASELRMFNRRETNFVAVAALGGYGFWMLRSLTLDSLAADHARVLFASAPLLMAGFSAFTRERADGRTFVGVLLGFVGCIMLFQPQGSVSPGVRPAILGLAAAACWALFSLAARPLVREEKALPVAGLVTGIGWAILLVTCLSAKADLFSVGARQLGLALVGGAATVGLMMAAWLKCLAGLPAPVAGSLWYLGAVLAGVAPYVGLGGEKPGAWYLVGGASLVFVGIQSGLAGRRRATVTISDILRGS